MSSEEAIMGPEKHTLSLHLEAPKVQWRMGKPPNYEAANKLFEHGRTKVLFFHFFFARSNIIFVS